MKRLLIAALLVVAGILCANAQSPVGQGGKQLNMGVGLYGRDLPLYVGVDFGVHPDITIGPQAIFDLDLDYFGLAFRGDYHFNSIMNIPRDWDFYAGANVGILNAIGNDNIYADAGLQVGGRYYWNNKWGINLEFGGGSSFGGRLGVSMLF